MMTLRDLINKLLGRETSSANTARERLQLVLAHDRVDMSSLTTDLLDKMRKEILDVVAKYVEIDFDEVAVSLETEDRMTALVANLPIKRTISGEIKFKKTDKADKTDKANKDIKKASDVISQVNKNGINKKLNILLKRRNKFISLKVIPTDITNLQNK